MAFQFLCPQGHLLQGDEAHAGLPTQCPVCGTKFIMPRGVGATAGPMAGPSAEPTVEPSGGEVGGGKKNVRDFLKELAEVESPAPSGETRAESVGALQEIIKVGEPAEPELLHIPCPNGHELETPLDMLGQEVICPHCGARFRPRRDASREHLAEVERIEQRRAQLWIQGAVAVAVLIVLGLAVMIWLSSRGR